MSDRIWPFDPVLSARGRLKEKITQRQINYILDLKHYSENSRYYDEIVNAIPGWKKKFRMRLGNLTKGHASFIILCLTGKLKPQSRQQKEAREELWDRARKIMVNEIKPSPLSGVNWPVPFIEEEESKV